MTEVNHRRGDHKKQRQHPVRDRSSVRSTTDGSLPVRGGYFPDSREPWKEMDMSFFGADRIDPLVGVVTSKGLVGNDFCNGKRGMRRSVAGAKKFVNSRTRARVKEALHRIEDTEDAD